MKAMLAKKALALLAGSIAFIAMTTAASLKEAKREKKENRQGKK